MLPLIRNLMYGAVERALEEERDLPLWLRFALRWDPVSREYYENLRALESRLKADFSALEEKPIAPVAVAAGNFHYESQRSRFSTGRKYPLAALSIAVLLFALILFFNPAGERPGRFASLEPEQPPKIALNAFDLANENPAEENSGFWNEKIFPLIAPMETGIASLRENFLFETAENREQNAFLRQSLADQLSIEPFSELSQQSHEMLTKMAEQDGIESILMEFASLGRKSGDNTLQ